MTTMLVMPTLPHRESDGTWTLWHPESPGVRLYRVKPGVLRRLGLNRSAFASNGETIAHHRRARKAYLARVRNS